MKKGLFLGLLSLAIYSFTYAQTGIPDPKDGETVMQSSPVYSNPVDPTVNNGVGINNTINVYPPDQTKKTGKTGSSWKNNHHGYCQWNYFRQIEIQQNENRDYWRGKYEGLREGIAFEKQKAPAPPIPMQKDWSEEIFWLIVVLGLIGLVMYLSNRNMPPPPVAPATTPVIVYPPAPAPPTPTLPVPPTASELMKLMKENGGTFKAGSDGSWAADIYENKKEKPATETAPVDVKEEKQ
jgi:hypothetical protein